MIPGPDPLMEPITMDRPNRKVSAAAIGGAFAALLAWIVQDVGGIDVPPGVEAAIATLVAGFAGYFTPEVPAE